MDTAILGGQIWPLKCSGRQSCFYILFLRTDISDRLNRYSMPVTKSKNGLYEVNLDQTNTARFLFGEDEPNAFPRRDTPDHNFPTLVRRDDQIVSFLFISSFCSWLCSRNYLRGCYPVSCQLLPAASWWCTSHAHCAQTRAQHVLLCLAFSPFTMP